MAGMKVVIITEGGREIGFGHVSRGTSLYEAFGLRGIRPKLIVNGDDSIREVLPNTDHEVFDWLKDQERLAESIHDADIAVVDSYLADKGIYDSVSRAGRLGVYFDDEKRIEYPAGIVINGAINAGRIDYPRKRGITYLVGARYLTLRKEFWDVPPKKIRKEPTSVLITFGADDPNGLTAKILAMLTKNYPGLTKNVIVGRWFGDTDSLAGCADARTNLIHSPDGLQMRAAMLDSDIAISAGGQTLCELAKVGIPTITTCLRENQQWNLNGWQEVGFAIYAGMAVGDDFPARVSAGIESLMPYEQRRLRCEISGEVMAGSRAVNVADGAIARLNNPDADGAGGADVTIRRATVEDCHELWVWRNHPEVRKWYFCKEGVTYQDHRRWFANKLRDPSTRIYIAEDALGIKVGQARFDTKEGSTSISVGLSPLQFGKGLGSRLIKAATEMFLDQEPAVREVIAQVIENNTASRKAFTKAGYVHEHDILNNNIPVGVYRFRLPPPNSAEARSQESRN